MLVQRLPDGFYIFLQNKTPQNHMLLSRTHSLCTHTQPIRRIFVTNPDRYAMVYAFKRNKNTSNVSLIYLFILHSFVYPVNIHKELLLSHL
jgi:hypothetical protein